MDAGTSKSHQSGRTRYCWVSRPRLLVPLPSRIARVARSPSWWYGLAPRYGEVFMIRAVFSTSLLALFSTTMVSHASVETCQLHYENVAWRNCIQFPALSDNRENRERLHYCQTYAALWFNRCVQEAAEWQQYAAERERKRRVAKQPRRYRNCGPSPSFHAGWHCR